ncbi:MAG: trigger factor, partial [Flavobacteriaceae bacterium]|nr:trigger factor [Flavobacteriaceae bacterium]
ADENKTLSEQEVNEEWERTEKGLRYQLIEGKLIEDYQLRVTFEELKEYTSERIRLQMAQYGQSEVEDKDLEAISARVLSNQDEVRRLSEHLQNQKMLAFFKKEIKFKQKKITFNDFLKEIYG